MLMLASRECGGHAGAGRASPRPSHADVRKAAEAKDVTRSVEFHQRIHPAERRDVRDRIVVDDPVATFQPAIQNPQQTRGFVDKALLYACPHSPCRQIAGRSRADRTSARWPTSEHPR